MCIILKCCTFSSKQGRCDFISFSKNQHAELEHLRHLLLVAARWHRSLHLHLVCQSVTLLPSGEHTVASVHLFCVQTFIRQYLNTLHSNHTSLTLVSLTKIEFNGCLTAFRSLSAAHRSPSFGLFSCVPCNNLPVILSLISKLHGISDLVERTTLPNDSPGTLSPF